MNWGKFRKKPVVVEAIQWDPEALLNIDWFPGGCKVNARSVRHDMLTGKLEIETLEGTMTANLGDWIVRGIEGELYPIRNDIFRATYEEVM